VTYVRVDRLIRDYAIGLLPEMFPGEEGVCFKAPAE
jgi:iron complex transport system substrate-binding protein